MFSLQTTSENVNTKTRAAADTPLVLVASGTRAGSLFPRTAEERSTTSIVCPSVAPGSSKCDDKGNGALPALHDRAERPLTPSRLPADSGARCIGLPVTACNQSPGESNYHLPQVWGTFLESFPWDWFITVVPDDIVHPESLEKLWGVFIHSLNQDLYGRSYYKDKSKGVLWAMGWERQRRGAPHGHGLIGGVPDYASRNQFYQWLKDHSAQFSKIEAYEKRRGAEYYMSKSTYAWKNGEIDLSHTLALYQGGSWISAKELHEQYCREYRGLTKGDPSAYVW